MTPRPARTAFAALAAWRLAVLIQQDTLTEALRDRIYRRFPRPNEYASASRTGWRLTRSENPDGGQKWVQDRPVAMPAPPGMGWEAVTASEGGEQRYIDGVWTTLKEPVTLVMGWTHARGTQVGKVVNCMACLTVWTSAAILLAHRLPVLRRLVGVLEVAGGALAVEYVLDAFSLYSADHQSKD